MLPSAPAARRCGPRRYDPPVSDADWTNLISATTGLVALGALGVSIWAARSSKRSAIAAEVSVSAAQQSADMATAADRRAATARHDAWSPERDVRISFEVVPSAQILGSNLFVTVETGRTYEMHAIGKYRHGSEQLRTRRLIRGGNPERVHLELMPPGRTETQIASVRLRFWPPALGVECADPWTCDCGRPGVPGLDDEPAHWDITRDVIL